MDDLKKLVNELYEGLQSMVFEELQHEDLLRLEHPEEINYELPKIYECLLNNKHDPMFEFYFENISEFLEDIIKIKFNDNKNIFLAIKVGLYYYWK